MSPRRSFSSAVKGGKPGSTPPGNRFSQQQQGQLKLYDFLPQIQEENVSKNKDANMFANKFANKSAKNTASAVSQSSCGGVNLDPLSLGGVNLDPHLLGGVNPDPRLSGGLNLDSLALGAAQSANRSPVTGFSRDASLDQSPPLRATSTPKDKEAQLDFIIRGEKSKNKNSQIDSNSTASALGNDRELQRRLNDKERDLNERFWKNEV